MVNITNWINGTEAHDDLSLKIKKYNPHNGKLISLIPDSGEKEVNTAVDAAVKAYQEWSYKTPVERGNILFNLASRMALKEQYLADLVAVETGKPPKDALGEVRAAIMQAQYFAGEGMRLFGKSLTSGINSKFSHTIRQSHGVAGLIVPANTPIANIAWKLFPALICGNTVVLKASEDAPAIAIEIAKIAKESNVPDGVVNIIQGGPLAGESLVNNKFISLISFTGSTNVGKCIAETAGKRLARVSLELGGKNSLVVCCDADISEAVKWSVLSAFSNAGQRCASASKIIVFDKVYDEFLNKFKEKTLNLRLGIEDNCDLGPVINRKQQLRILESIKDTVNNDGGNLICGGGEPEDDLLNLGYYIEPTIICSLPENAKFHKTEIFGPVVSVIKVKDIKEALKISNNTDYGLTAAIHTKSIDKAMWYARRIRTGVININIGSFGSEPHMPFGGFGISGNGTREPGVEALDVYSEIKNISILNRENLID